MKRPDITPGPWNIRETSTKSSFSKNWREINAAGCKARRTVVCADAYHSSQDGDVYGVRIFQPDALAIAAVPELLDIAERAMIGEHEADEIGRQCRCSQCSLTRDARAVLTKAGYQF